MTNFPGSPLPNSESPVIIAFTRGGIIESQHRAQFCITNSKGEVILYYGNPQHITFMRSSAKPLQAAALLTLGIAEAYNLDDQEIALICGSHSGEQVHIDILLSMMAKIGIEPNQLHCGVHAPLDNQERDRLIQENQSPSMLHHNCSGKHTGMIAAAKLMQLDLESYTHPSHLVQKKIISFITQMAGIKDEEIIIGIDGCSVPVHGLSLAASAVAWARLVDPIGLPDSYISASNRVVTAMRSYPTMVAGTHNRICTPLIKHSPTQKFIAKAGAEGFYAAAWQDRKTSLGYGLVVKVEDGAQRARDPLVIHILQKLGVLSLELPDELQPFAPQSLKNWRGLEIGHILIKMK